MKTILTLLLFASLSTFGQAKRSTVDSPQSTAISPAVGDVWMIGDTTATVINFGEKNMLRFKQLEDRQRKYDSLVNVERNNLLDVILSSHGIDKEELVKLTPRGNGEFVTKTKKKK